MAAVTGDLLQIVDTQRYLGETVLNVYYYRVTAVAGIFDAGYTDVLNDFKSRVVDPVRQIQMASLAHTQLELRNLSNGIDIATVTLTTDNLGVLTGANEMPSYVTLGFKLVRESLVTRNGYKRISGLNEGFTAGNTNAYPPALTDAIAAGMADELSVALAPVATPIIVKRPIPAPGTPYEFSFVGSVVVTGLGTQNTRKPGRGI